jgi:hypothetical protein
VDILDTGMVGEFTAARAPATLIAIGPSPVPVPAVAPAPEPAPRQQKLLFSFVEVKKTVQSRNGVAVFSSSFFSPKRQARSFGDKPKPGKG